jgi:phosphatidylglycerophosphate synthase
MSAKLDILPNDTMPNLSASSDKENKSQSQHSKPNETKREQTSVLSPLEQIALQFLVRRMPAWVSPDHLSILGLLAMLFAGVAYFFSKENTQYLHIVNFCLALNWFGDSLDGTLARFRNKQRPKYGFYVDHMIDTFGMLFLMVGLIASGYISERVGLGILIVYFMLSINSYLAAYSLNVFSISFWKFSPTELRILLALGNLVLFKFPYCKLFGHKYLSYDVGGVVSIIGMSAMLIVSTIKNTKALYEKERV